MIFDAEQFEMDGWTVLLGALPRHIVEDLRAAIVAHRSSFSPSEEVLYPHTSPPPGKPGMDALMEQWFNAYRRAGTLATTTAVEETRRIAAQILGAPAVLFQDVLMVKHARHREFPWHQDFPYWPVDNPLGVIVWAPLDPTDAGNGGLVVASGSHQAGPGPAIDLHNGERQVGYNEDIPAPLASTQLALMPGDLALFHPLTWHRSGVNSSSHPRRAWSASWLHPSARWAPDRAPRHPLSAGLLGGSPVSEQS